MYHAVIVNEISYTTLLGNFLVVRTLGSVFVTEWNI